MVDLFSLPYNHRPEVVTGVLEEECAGLLQAFFAALREKERRSPNDGKSRRHKTGGFFANSASKQGQKARAYDKATRAEPLLP